MPFSVMLRMIALFVCVLSEKDKLYLIKALMKADGRTFCVCDSSLCPEEGCGGRVDWKNLFSFLLEYSSIHGVECASGDLETSHEQSNKNARGCKWRKKAMHTHSTIMRTRTTDKLYVPCSGVTTTTQQQRMHTDGQTNRVLIAVNPTFAFL